MAEQQINLSDLNVEQLSELKKQLDQVSPERHSSHSNSLDVEVLQGGQDCCGARRRSLDYPCPDCSSVDMLTD